MSRQSLILMALVSTAGLLFACSPDVTDVTGPDRQAAPQQAIEPAIGVQARNVDRIMGIAGVVGTGVGLDANGTPVIKVFTQVSGVRGIPESLEGVPVNVEVTGMFVARSDPTTRFGRPVPIGVSTGHPEITAGTIGARVTDGTDVYILSNNHVLANQNDALDGDPALQPGAYDGGTVPDDVIGWLHDFEPIDFDGGDNTFDAAIALSATDLLGYSTPTDDGYGTPSSRTQEATVGQMVRKYGRTTGLTEGQVSEISATVDVCYECAGPMCRKCNKSARFVDQIAITPGGFSRGGDSGSLIVDGDNHSMGLLFAGSNTHTLANRIDPILQRFNVTIDDGSSGSNSPPVASFTFNCTDTTCTFDGAGSSDSDGSIVSWDWDFGDGDSGTGATTTHTYDPGTYVVVLTVTDDAGATDRESQDVSAGSLFHVGNLDRASTKGGGGGTWTAWVRITIHQAGEAALGGAVVAGSWDIDGVIHPAVCGATDSSGTCEVSSPQIPNRTGNIVFTVESASRTEFGYDEAANHDPDGNSDGTKIRVFKTNSDDYGPEG